MDEIEKSAVEELHDPRGERTKNARFRLTADVREETHEPGTLDREREFALMGSADSGMLRINDLCLCGNETLQEIRLFIIDFLEIL
jgi:hypothetical protein